MALVGWPPVVDDSGSGQDGTVWDAAFNDAQKASIENELVSSTNPAVKTKTIIDEVVAARGSKTSLDERLDVVLNEDGTLKSQSSLVTTAQAGSLAGANLIPNDTFLLWSLGDTLAPDFTLLTGAGAAVARCGSGLADTTSAGYGAFCARLTSGGALARLSFLPLSAADFAKATALRGRKVAVGILVKSSIPSHARVVLDDGVTQTASAYHSGGGTFQWLSVVHTMSGAASLLALHLEAATAGAAYFGAVTLLLSDVAPVSWVPCHMQQEVLHFYIPGVVATGIKLLAMRLDSFGFVSSVALRAETAPVGADLIVDVNGYDGAAFTSMFTTKPRIVASGNHGGGPPDGTYARRCLRGSYDATIPIAGEMLSIDVDQVGSGTPGSDLTVEIRVRKYIRALEQLLAYNV